MSDLTLDRDSWSTPQWLYNWLDSIYDFDVDLCASSDNAKCSVYFTKQEDALSQRWDVEGVHKTGFCNPPYSDIAPWLAQSVAEAFEGFTSVHVIPTPNGEKYYDLVFGFATSITFIQGRVAFIAPFDYTIKGKKGKPDRHIKKGDEVGGNTRGSCVVEFSKKFNRSPPVIRYVNRDELKLKFS
jgi:phage N-6-adenine-methyltransferase